MKKTLSFALALVMCLSLLVSIPAAAYGDGWIQLAKSNFDPNEEIVVTVSGITAQMVEDYAYVSIYKKGAAHSEYGEWSSLYEQGTSQLKFTAPAERGEYEMRLYKKELTYRAEDLVTSVPFTVGGSSTSATNPWTKASDWAVPEMEKANGQGLIPDALKNKDLTSNVTRAEFAAVAVKVYENLTGTKATAPAKNPFDDTSDAEVLKAYNTGLMVGVSDSKFDPGAILNREQMATALTRVLKRAYIPGWTMQADGDYTLNFAQPSKFADDAATSDWAKPSVYFMFAKEIISGTGGNQFSPKQNATREQSVAIGLRIVEKLKGKSLDYAKSGIENPPSGNIDPQLIGHWESGGYSGGYYYSELFHWFFFENGTFYYYRVTTSLYAYSANYTVSNGRIYFTNVVFANDGYQEGYRNNEPDSYVDYEIFVEYFENRGQDVERLKIDNTGGCWTGSPTCNRASMDGFEDIGW